MTYESLKDILLWVIEGNDLWELKRQQLKFACNQGNSSKWKKNVSQYFNIKKYVINKKEILKVILWL